MYYNFSFLTDSQFCVLCKVIDDRIDKVLQDIDFWRNKYGFALFNTTNICKNLKLEYLHLLNIKSYLRDFKYSKNVLDISIKHDVIYTNSCNKYLDSLRGAKKWLLLLFV